MTGRERYSTNASAAALEAAPKSLTYVLWKIQVGLGILDTSIIVTVYELSRFRVTEYWSSSNTQAEESSEVLRDIRIINIPVYLYFYMTQYPNIKFVNAERHTIQCFFFSRNIG